MDTNNATFVFSGEIEQAFVKSLWHTPSRLEGALAQIDPQVHLTQPHLRLILEAIRISVGEIGDADWVTVISILREQNALEDCGGLDGLNSLWDYDGFTTHDQIFGEYIRLLKEYASARRERVPVFPFTGGKGTLELNKAKRRETDCDYLGQIRVLGRPYTARAWIAPAATFINLTFTPLS
jgi:hypothetical protein